MAVPSLPYLLGTKRRRPGGAPDRDDTAMGRLRIEVQLIRYGGADVQNQNGRGWDAEGNERGPPRHVQADAEADADQEQKAFQQRDGAPARGSHFTFL